MQTQRALRLQLRQRFPVCGSTTILLLQLALQRLLYNRTPCFRLLFFGTTAGCLLTIFLTQSRPLV
jgi:hypothetical protein